MTRRAGWLAIGTAVLTLACMTGVAQAQRGQQAGGYGMGGTMRMGPGLMGKWWKNSQLVQKLALSDSQIQQIEKVFLDHRLQLIDLRANLQKQEAILHPLVEADTPDEGQVAAQIDRVAQARASLEKSRALMFLAIRKVLTPEQWKTLQAQQQNGMMRNRGTRAVAPGTN